MLLLYATIWLVSVVAIVWGELENDISPNVLSLATLDNNTTTFSFVSPRCGRCVAIFVAQQQQQDLFPFLIITLNYEYQLY
jgi:hypothetical protein